MRQPRSFMPTMRQPRSFGPTVRKPRSLVPTVLAMLLALLPVLTAAQPVQADSFAWSAVQSVTVGASGGYGAPALDFASGRTGLEASNSDLIVDQNLPNQYFASNSGGFIDLGAVDFARVPPLSGTYQARVQAAAGHVYLWMNTDGTRVAKLKVTQIVPGEKQYSMPTVYLDFAGGTLAPGTKLQPVGSVDLSPGTGGTSGTGGSGGTPQPAGPFSWSDAQTVSVGNNGGIIEPSLSFDDGRTGLESTYSDLLVSDGAGPVSLSSNSGGFLDLGPVVFGKVTPVSGNLQSKVSAVAGHVYLFQAGTRVAKFHLIQVIPGGAGTGMATVYLRWAKGTLDRSQTLPAAGSVDFGTQSGGQPGFNWTADQMGVMGNVGGILSPAFTFASGQAGLYSSSADMAVEQNADGIWLTSARGAFIELGAVSFAKVPPLTGTSSRRVAAVPGHVYIYQAGTFFTRLQLIQVTPDSKVNGTPRLYFTYATGHIDPDGGLAAVGSVDLGGIPPVAPGNWSCVVAVTLGRSGNTIQDALTLASGQVGLASSFADLLVEQNLPDVFLHSYSGTLVDLGPVDMAKVPPLRGGTATKVAAVAGHVYLFQSGISVVKLQVTQVTAGEKQRSMPTVYLRYATTTVAPGAALPSAAGFDFASAPATALSDCQPASSGGGTGSSGGGSGGGTGGGTGSTGGNSGDQSAQAQSHALVFQLDNPVAMVDGQKKSLDVALQLVGGRTMVPLRFLGEALGAQITWDGSEQKVTYTLGSLQLQLWVGRSDALLNGQTRSMDVPPTIVNGRTLIPLRFASENLGANVRYEAASRTVGVASGDAAAAQDKQAAPKAAEPTPPAEQPKLPDRPQQPERRGCPDAYAVQQNTRLVKVDLQSGLFTTVFETLYGIYHFRISPTCNSVAYEDGNGRLVLRSFADGSETVLYNPLSPAVDVSGPMREGTRRFACMPWSWSPDGSKVLCLVLGAFDQTPNLVSVSASGGDATVLAPGFDATWGNSGLVAGDGGSLSLYADTSLSGGRTLSYQDVAPGDGSLSYMASLSDNGKFLAYVGRGNSDVYTYDVNSDASTLTFNDTSLAAWSFPRASNDGSTVLAAKLGDLWLITADGARQLTQAGDLSNPDW